MKIGIIGAGRMGKILAQRLSTAHQVVLFDSQEAALHDAMRALEVESVSAIENLDVACCILAVPDTAVEGCMHELAQSSKQMMVFCIATNSSRERIETCSTETLRGLNVKIIGHAGEMGRGATPVVVVDNGAPDIVDIAVALFKEIGTVIVGDADKVASINTIATEEALKAAVALENALCEIGVDDDEIIRCAIAHVAPGVMRAYAEDDLGPFARGVVCRLRDKSSTVVL